MLGRQYVVVETIGSVQIKHAYVLGDSIWVTPYMPETRTELLPGGKIGRGACYVESWSPITDRTKTYWEKS